MQTVHLTYRPQRQAAWWQLYSSRKITEVKQGASAEAGATVWVTRQKLGSLRRVTGGRPEE